MPPTIAIRPRSVSEIVDAAFQVLRTGYAQYVMLMGLAYVPWLVIVMLTSRSLLTGAEGGTPSVTRYLLLALGEPEHARDLAAVARDRGRVARRHRVAHRQRLQHCVE